MRWWKVAGFAAFAGVAATGVVIVRAERRRRAYTPEEIRGRLHARYAEAAGRAENGTAPGGAVPCGAVPCGAAPRRGRSWPGLRRARHGV